MNVKFSLSINFYHFETNFELEVIWMHILLSSSNIWSTWELKAKIYSFLKTEKPEATTRASLRIFSADNTIQIYKNMWSETSLLLTCLHWQFGDFFIHLVWLPSVVKAILVQCKGVVFYSYIRLISYGNLGFLLLSNNQ